MRRSKGPATLRFGRKGRKESDRSENNISFAKMILVNDIYFMSLS